MSVTDAQFRQFLRGRNNTKLTTLAEIDFAYQGAPGSTVTLNPADKGSGVTLSNGNLTASFAAVNPMVRATQSLVVGTGYWTGKYYWEVTVGSLAGGVAVSVGIAKAAATLNNYLGQDANGWGYYGLNGNKLNGGASTAFGAAFTTGDVIGFTYDVAAGTLGVYKNNVNQGLFTGLSGTFFPAVSGSTGGTEACTINFGANGFIYAIPVSYSALLSADALIPTVGTIYLSDRKYVTEPSYTPANIRYRDVILSAPDFERAIDLKRLGGRGAMSVGSLKLNNADNSVGFLLDAIIDAREVRIYVGDSDWPRADFRLVNVAVVSSVKAANDEELSVELRDKNYLLDDTIVGSPILTGPNAGRPKPIALGHIKNFDITPYLLDASALTYYINDFPLSGTPLGALGSLQDVRDAGISLVTSGLFAFSSGTMTANAGTDTLTYAAHGLAVDDVVVAWSGISWFAGLSAFTQYWVIAAGLTANDFRLSLTRGGAAVDITGTVMSGTWALDRMRFYIDAAAATITLSSTPAGRVTMDWINPNIGTTPHVIFKYLLQNYTSLAASEYDSTAIDALDAAEISVISFGRAILDRMNVLDLLDEIAQASYSWYAWNAAGVLTVGRLDLSNLDAATAIDSITVTDIDRDLACENLPLQWGRVIVDADRNVVTQTDGLSPLVTAADKSKWSQKFQTRTTTTDPGGTTYPANWWDYHKSAIDSKPIELSIDSSGIGVPAITAVADATTALFKPWTRPHRCSVGLDKYALNPGDCVTLTYPRYGLAAGKKVRVMSVKPRFSEGLCDLVMVRQVTPEYTRASYS